MLFIIFTSQIQHWKYGAANRPPQTLMSRLSRECGKCVKQEYRDTESRT